MKLKQKLEDGWTVIKEMKTQTGVGYIVARPYTSKNGSNFIAKMGGREFGIISEGVFRISTRQQCVLIRLILESAVMESSYLKERKKYKAILEEIKFRGKR